MQDKYLDHYTATIFHKWFMAISNAMGDSPFRAVVQNYLYTQDPENPKQLRIQSFITALRQFHEQAVKLPDPDPAPTVYSVDITEDTLKEMDRLDEEYREAMAKRAEAKMKELAPAKLDFSKFNESDEQTLVTLDFGQLESTRPPKPKREVVVNPDVVDVYSEEPHNNS